MPHLAHPSFGERAPEPTVPHVVCLGGPSFGGFAWHPDEDRRRCFAVTVGFAPEMVGAIFDSTGVDHLIALDAAHKEGRGWFLKLFPQQCAACGADHWHTAQQYLRALRKYIHPEAIDALRAAKVPVFRIVIPSIRRDGVDVAPSTTKGIPYVPDNSDLTLDLQLAYSMRFKHKTRYSIGSNRRQKVAQ